MMQHALSTRATAVLSRQMMSLRAAAGVVCQKRPLPRQHSTTRRSSKQVSSAAGTAASVPLPTALRRLAASDGRMHHSQQQHGSRSFSTNSSSVASASLSSGEDEAAPAPAPTATPAFASAGEGTLSSDGLALAGSLSTPASSSASSYTVVKHPPVPGWEFPPVPAGCAPAFAVIRLGNTQYKVTKDDVIVAEKLEGDIGTTLEISDVLLVGTKDSTVVGRPTVPGATVKLFVEEQTRDKKVLAGCRLLGGRLGAAVICNSVHRVTVDVSAAGSFGVIVLKKRRRKSSKTTKGHRREVTLLRVMEISSWN